MMFETKGEMEAAKNNLLEAGIDVNSGMKLQEAIKVVCLCRL